jgi:hypothetical protein
MTDALMSWVRKGGTLISAGVPGIWTPYGEDNLGLVSEVFGKSQVSDIDHGKWRWKWHLHERRPGVKTIQDDAAGNVLLAQARYGQGAVLIATNGFDSPDQQQFYQALDAAIGQRPARCVHDAFELTIRSGNDGRYLCVLNPDTRGTREDQLIVTGKYAGIEDLGIGSGVSISADLRDGETRFNLRLHPGESTVLLLKP